MFVTCAEFFLIVYGRSDSPRKYIITYYYPAVIFVNNFILTVGSLKQTELLKVRPLRNTYNDSRLAPKTCARLYIFGYYTLLQTAVAAKLYVVYCR